MSSHRSPNLNELSDQPGPSSLPSTRPQSPTSKTLRRPASHGRLSKLMIPGRSRSGSSASQASLNLDDSGGTSGRTTPELKRRAGKAAAASLLASDGKYKKFAQMVDKSLQSFENVNEWADFISFLSRLLKTLQTPSPPYTEIPRKLIVAKRLAQCLNPALPSGVHQRALDVYAYIFSIIGVDGLKRDLLIWSSGLFPFFQYAATSVRPLLIKIYETYYLPLGENLRPATKAFVLALLPGMEEETGDFFDKILSLLDRLSEAVKPSFFLQNIFLILISSPTSRLSALNYLGRRLLKAPEASGGGIESGLIIRGVSAVLNDENVLVRRSGLDLLLRVIRLDGDTIRDAEAKDKELLMRSACGVVLQRELSLSRRVYTWLLGSGETSEEQTAYFTQYGLDLLITTLHSDMEKLGSPPESLDAQRPFKVFLSLLDKWEIGSVLSERLAISSLRTVKDASESGPSTVKDEILATAAAVYEAVEPVVIWKELHSSVLDELNSKGSGAIELVRWIVASIPQTDEEINSVHVPIVLDTVLSAITSDTLTVEAELEAFHLARTLTELIPVSTYAKGSSITSDVEHTRSVADLLYSKDGDPHSAQGRLHTEVLPRIVQNAFVVFEKVAVTQEIESLLEAVRIVSVLIDHESSSLALVNGHRWLAAIIEALSKISSFAVVEALVVAALKASRCSTFTPAITITTDTTISAILDSLFRYLRPSASLYHIRAVELLWDYNQLAEIHTLENVIARRMSKLPFDSAAFDAFGIFWRLTDDSMLPGEIFHVPVNVVLDALKSSDPNVQRQAETWMRCNLRSYFRVLDPILSRLLDPTIRYNDGVYAGPVDLALVRYYIDSISALFKFGAQGLSKACQSTDIRGSPHPSLITRAEGAFPNAVSYLELMVLSLIRFIETEAPEDTGRSAKPLVVRVQSASLDLLQSITARGDVSQAQLFLLKKSLVTKLQLAVHQGNLTLQSKMLHLLHSVISASSASTRHQSARHSPNPEKAVAEPKSDFEDALVQTIIDGLSNSANTPVLQHWIDFILMTAPMLSSRPSLLHSLAECFSQQIRLFILRINSVYEKVSVLDESLNVADAEVVMVLNALERVLVLLCSQPGKVEETSAHGEGGSRILGLVSTVFTVEAPSNDPAKIESPRYLDDAIHSLLVTWTITNPTTSGGAYKSQTLEKIGVRARKVLEKIFKAQPSSVIASCVHVWSLCSEQVTDAAIFDCVDALTPSAQRVVELLCQIVSGKSGRTSMSEYRADPAFLAFLEAYVSRLEAPIAVQVWTTLFNFARDVLASLASSTARVQLLAILRCLTVLAMTVSKTSALEDRRLRRDLQDTYAKVLDHVVTNAAKITDGGLWERERDQVYENGSSDPKKNGLVTTSEEGLQKINDYLASSIIPNLRTLLVEPDRVNSACSGIGVTIVVPAFKRGKVDPSVLRIVLEIAKIPSAVKTWRLQISDVFADSRFFRAKSAEEVGYWKVLIGALMDSDKERFGDLLSRITSASSANIFSNRDQEMLAKSLNLRRLSFVLIAAERNGSLSQLPAIQERLVEMLRSSAVSPRVHSEVYLCLRVLMCRISPQHLTNFWPVILGELLRIFELTMDDPPEDGSEQLQLVLAACKFLDLLLVIQSEDFQIHQWMFVTDTTDAAYPPEEHTPEAIMDRLSDILSEGVFHGAPPVSEKDGDASSIALPNTTDRGENGLRRPRLSSVRSLTSLYQLQSFFSRASMDTFEGVYENVGVDWDVVEDDLNAEIFDS
nr:uncharacterized protein CI109_001565 [Kwoniella shandongensis]KAA5530159.1 hypothetical protein CI109_001565 [Kwoniella shandongensis]